MAGSAMTAELRPVPAPVQHRHLRRRRRPLDSDSLLVPAREVSRGRLLPAMRVTLAASQRLVARLVCSASQVAETSQPRAPVSIRRLEQPAMDRWSRFDSGRADSAWPFDNQRPGRGRTPRRKGRPWRPGSETRLPFLFRIAFAQPHIRSGALTPSNSSPPAIADFRISAMNIRAMLSSRSGPIIRLVGLL